MPDLEHLTRDELLARLTAGADPTPVPEGAIQRWIGHRL